MPSTKVPPVIDFSDFLSGDPDRVQKCASQIRAACTTQGFFQIVNHSITRELQIEIFRLSKEFFALPLEEKLKLDKCMHFIHFSILHSTLRRSESIDELT